MVLVSSISYISILYNLVRIDCLLKYLLLLINYLLLKSANPTSEWDGQIYSLLAPFSSQKSYGINSETLVICIANREV